MKLIIDMNLGAAWADFLRGASFDALHWSELGRIEAKDSDIVAVATEMQACVVTRDRDFGQLIATSRALSPSVVLIRGTRVLPRTFGPQVLAALRDHRDQLRDGALVTVEASRTRCRSLPIDQ